MFALCARVINGGVGQAKPALLPGALLALPDPRDRPLSSALRVAEHGQRLPSGHGGVDKVPAVPEALLGGMTIPVPEGSWRALEPCTNLLCADREGRCQR